MKIKHAILLGAMSSLLLTGFASNALAHGGKPMHFMDKDMGISVGHEAGLAEGHGLHEFKMLRKLDLTEAQELRIKTIMQDARAQAKNADAARIQSFDLETMDAEQLNALQNQQRERREQIFKVRYDVHQTLTPEQREQLAAWQSKREDKRARYAHKSDEKALPRVFEKLDLSDEQIAQITPLHEQIQANRQASKVLRDSFREQERTLLAKDQLDIATWQQYADDYYAAMRPFHSADLNYKQQIDALLTDTQKAQLADMRDNMKSRMKDKMKERDGKHRDGKHKEERWQRS